MHLIISVILLMFWIEGAFQTEPVKLSLYPSSGNVDEAVLQHPSNEQMAMEQRHNLRGKPGQGYYISVLVGTPPQTMNVLVDTGSSNFALAAAQNENISKFYHKDQSSTYRSGGVNVFVPYTQGNWKGMLGSDVISLPSLPNMTVRASFVGIDSSEKFFINGSNWQGILGMAYSEIARPDHTVEPFFDAFIKQTSLPNVFSMQLCGTVNSSKGQNAAMGGSMVLGGIDTDLYKPPIFYSPLYKEWYYEIIIADILVNKESLNMDCKEYNFDKTIVDSGTTNLRLPKKVFNKLVETMKDETKLPDAPPAEFWAGVDILCWPKGHSPLNLFPDVKMSLLMSDNNTFNLVVAPQQYLRKIGDQLSKDPVQDCYKFAIASSTTGTVIGAVIMEGYYVIFDRENKTIGWALTVCNNTQPGSTLRTSSLAGPFKSNVSVHACAYVKASNNQSTLTLVAYVMAGVCGLCVVPVLVSLVQWQLTRWRQCSKRQELPQTADVSGLLNNAVTA